MDAKRTLLQADVRCRAGSSENDAKALSFAPDVRCRAGSSESRGGSLWRGSFRSLPRRQLRNYGAVL